MSYSPVNVGDVIDLKITKLGKSGDPFGYYSGIVVFVQGTKIGDNVKAKIVFVGPSFAKAVVVD